MNHTYVRGVAGEDVSRRLRGRGSEHGARDRERFLRGGARSDPVRFCLLDEMGQYGWSEEDGAILSKPITDSGIAVARKYEFKRLIIHYMQPRNPFIEASNPSGVEVNPFDRKDEETVVDALWKGKRTREAFWEAYGENLRIVLDDVAVLLSNGDAETVAITTDYGTLWESQAPIIAWPAVSLPSGRACRESKRPPMIRGRTNRSASEGLWTDGYLGATPRSRPPMKLRS